MKAVSPNWKKNGSLDPSHFCGALKTYFSRELPACKIVILSKSRKGQFQLSVFSCSRFIFFLNSLLVSDEPKVILID